VTDLLTLFIVLVRFEAELCNAVDARLRTVCALPLSGFGTLRVIARHRACRVRDIAEQLAITVGATSKRVDRLEAPRCAVAGHIRRTAAPRSSSSPRRGSGCWPAPMRCSRMSSGPSSDRT
jgi:DNA-binding MarR family transcriptional regulator